MHIKGKGDFATTHRVETVDTVANGDAFKGALAAGLAKVLSFSEAMEWAMAIGAFSVAKPGAQPSMPRQSELMELLDQANK